MGLIPAPPNCFITNFETQDRPWNANQINYFINFYGEQIHLSFEPNHQNSDIVNKNKHIFRGLIANNKLNTEQLLNNDKLKRIIETSGFPKTPKEKLDNFMLYLGSFHHYDGSTIEISNQTSKVIDLLYFKNYHEFNFYINNLIELKFINQVDILEDAQGDFPLSISFTYLGLNYLIQIQEYGEYSLNCFIAMSFSKESIELREKIKLVCNRAGYKPILVDEVNIDNEVTINDAIISNIKQSKFIIADFTEQKHGVYFEAGYALGKGKQVIYTCSKADFENIHFDTNHYPHIVYENLDELEIKLLDKINAWIE